MITFIEIDGFKTFQNFKLTLAPFQVIVGLNGVGKSNLFDALRLLSRLAEVDLRTAFQGLRGDAGELFTTFSDGSSTNKMRFAFDLFVEPNVQDSWGAHAELKYTRLRYELEIIRRKDTRGLERLYVNHESLTIIPRSKDYWLKQHEISTDNLLKKLTGGRTPFISTTKESNITTISLHQDGRKGNKASVAEKIESTVLSGVNNTQFPHAFAVREEMRSWRFLQLNPEVLRQPSSMLASPYLASDGGNLPTAISRLISHEPYVFNDISRDLANLVPGIIELEIKEDLERDQFIIQAKTQDGRLFSSRVLSDGTLRALALIALKNDPEHHGVLCFEEPENGVHPFRLKSLIGVLQDLSTDFKNLSSNNEPLRQLLVNTHSPVLMAQPNVLPHVLFAYLTPSILPDKNNKLMRITRIVPVKADGQLKLELDIKKPEEAYTAGQVIEYLNSADFGETILELQTNHNGR